MKSTRSIRLVIIFSFFLFNLNPNTMIGQECPIDCFRIHNDIWNYQLMGEELEFSYLLANDELTINYDFSIVSPSGNLWNSGADITITPTSIIVSNLPFGNYWFTYEIRNLDLDCGNAFHGGQVSIVNIPMLPECEACQGNELFCYGDFESFSLAAFWLAEIGDPMCGNMYNHLTTRNEGVFQEPNNNQFLRILNYSGREGVAYLPISPSVLPGESVNISLDAISVTHNSTCLPTTLEILGTSQAPCSNYDQCNDTEILCSSNPENCIGSIDFTECQQITYGGYVSILEDLEFQNHNLTMTNNSTEPWDYIILTNPRDTYEESGIQTIFVDNIGIRSECIIPPPFQLCCDPENNYACIMDEDCEQLLHEFCEGCWIEWVSPPEFNHNHPNNPNPANISECFSLEYVEQLGLPADYVYEGIIHIYDNGIDNPVDFSGQLDCSNNTFSFGSEAETRQEAVTSANALISVSLSPNPTYGMATIKLEQVKRFNFKVYTSLGLLIQQQDELESDYYEFEITHGTGLYFVVIEFEGQKHTFKLLNL